MTLKAYARNIRSGGGRVRVASLITLPHSAASLPPPEDQQTLHRGMGWRTDWEEAGLVIQGEGFWSTRTFLSTLGALN